jgi:hypothetical protein
MPVCVPVCNVALPASVCRPRSLDTTPCRAHARPAAQLELTGLLERGGSAEGWSLIADKSWIQTYRKKDPDSPINLTRCFASCNMPADKFMEIFMDPLIKTKWDEEVATCEIVGGEGWDKDGYIVRQIAKIPLINQREMIWRWIWVKDHPEPGAHTAVIYSEKWDTPPPPNTYRVEAKSARRACRRTLSVHELLDPGPSDCPRPFLPPARAAPRD